MKRQPAADMAIMCDLLRRAHDALTRPAENAMLETEWDALADAIKATLDSFTPSKAVAP